VAGSVFAAGVSKGVVARLLEDGTMDADGFGNGGVTVLSPDQQSPVVLSGLGVDSTGRIIAAGTLTLGANDSDFAIFRLDSDGAQDFGFNEGMLTIAFDIGAPAARKDMAQALTVLADDSILIAGSAEHAVGQRQMALAQVDQDGNLSGLGGSGKLSPIFCDVCVDAVANAMTVQSDGSIVLAGTVEANGDTDFGVLRVQADGIIDLGFGAQGRVFVDFDLNPDAPNDEANAVFLQNGRVVVAGSASAPGVDQHVFAIARLQSDDLIFADDFETIEP